MMAAVVSFFIAGAVSLALTPLVRRFALSRGWIDRPDPRKIHSGSSTPRLGGLAIVAGFAVAALAAALLPSARFDALGGELTGLAVGLVIICLTGVIDDIRGLSPWCKLIAQFVAATALVMGGLHISLLSNPFGESLNLGVWAIPLTLIWVVGITNAINLLDGLDGLAAGVTAIVLVVMTIGTLRQGLAAAPVLSAAMAGAAVGFLPYNYHPASIFMGDTGSLSLGFTVAAVSMMGFAKAAVGTALLVPVIAMAVPLLDTVLAIVRRAVRGKRLFKPDMGHLHHRLLKLDPTGNQARVVNRLYFLTACYGLIALSFTDARMRGAVAFAALVLTLAVSGLWIKQLFYVTSGQAALATEGAGDGKPASDHDEQAREKREDD